MIVKKQRIIIAQWDIINIKEWIYNQHNIIKLKKKYIVKKNQREIKRVIIMKRKVLKKIQMLIWIAMIY